MKKFILALAFFTISSVAMASGKLTFQPMLYPKTDKVRMQVGLAVYEKLVGPFAYNGWAGYGDGAFEGKKSEAWFTHKHLIEVQASSKFQFGFGYQAIKEEGNDIWDERLLGKFTYQIW